MKAIRTRYYGPGNVRGARITASDGNGNTATISYPHELNSDEANALAVTTLCRKMGWHGATTGGEYRSDMFWVFLDGNSPRSAGAEHEKAEAPVVAEYLKAVAPVLAEYEKALAPFAEQLKVWAALDRTEVDA